MEFLEHKKTSLDDAAVKSVDPEDEISNVDGKTVSATEEQVVDEIPGIQEVGKRVVRHD